MRVAALYDIHGNLPALEAVLEEVEREAVDLIVVGGDIVYGAFPAETLAIVVELGERAALVRGNADREVVEVARGERPPSSSPLRADAWVVEQLTPGEIDVLAALPPTITVDVDGLGDALFCHATPRNDVEFFLEHTAVDIAAPMLGHTRERTVVCGHTHMQFDRRIDRWRVVNAGSVGMPYEREPGAYWALLGPDVGLRRTAYDVERAAARVRLTDWPNAEAFARDNMLQVPSRAEALAVFEPQVGARGA